MVNEPKGIGAPFDFAEVTIYPIQPVISLPDMTRFSSAK